MPIPVFLSDAECPECGEEPEWWTKDEPTIVKVQVRCGDCGREFPTRVLKKNGDDTSDAAIEEAARDVVETEHGSIF